jgi:hypothetical protein
MKAGEYVYATFKEFQEVGDKAGSKTISNKWIYVFRTTKDKNVVCYREVFVNKSGKFQLVNPKDRTKLLAAKDEVHLIWVDRKIKVNNYFCLSQIQLPDERIQKIKSSLDEIIFTNKTLSEGNSLVPAHFRVMKIPIHKSSANSTAAMHDSMAVIYLTDYFSVAKRLNALYVSKRDEYLTWINDEKFSEKYLIDRIQDILTQNESFKKHLKDKGSSLEESLSAYKEDEEYRIKAYDKYSAQLSSWLDTNEFLAVLDDYNSGDDDLAQKGEEEYSRIIHRLCESNPGRFYFLKNYKNKDSWLNQSLFHAGRKGHEAFWRLVEQLSTTIVTYDTEPIQTFSDIVERRTDTVLHRWMHANSPMERTVFGHLMAEEREFQVQFVNVKVVQPGRSWAKTLEDAKISDPLKSVIAIFDIALCARALNETRRDADFYYRTAELSRAITDMITLATGFLNKRWAYKLIPVLGFISGIIEAVTGGYDCYRNWTEGDYDAAVGAGVGVIGSVTAIAGMVIIKAGVATTTTIIGIPIGVLLIIVGAVVSGIGCLIVAFCDDTALEEWLEHCYWGDSYGGPGEKDWSEEPFTDWVGNLEMQIRALHNILFNFEIDVKIYTFSIDQNMPYVALPWHQDPLTAKEYLDPHAYAHSPIQQRAYKNKGIGLTIKPTIVTPSSYFKVDLWLEYYGSTSPQDLDQRILVQDLHLDPTFTWVNTPFMGKGSNAIKCDEVKKPIGSEMKIRDLVVFCLDENSPVPIKAKKFRELDFLLQGSAAVKVVCKVILDIYGDGRFTYPWYGYKRIERILLNSYIPDDPMHTFF